MSPWANHIGLRINYEPNNVMFLLSSFGNLFGPDALIIFLFLIILGVPVIGVIALVLYLCSRDSGKRRPPTTTERLQQLELLKQQGLISDAEYETQRHQIISGV